MNPIVETGLQISSGLALFAGFLGLVFFNAGDSTMTIYSFGGMFAFVFIAMIFGSIIIKDNRETEKKP